MPTIRRPHAEFLFVRDWWEPAWKRAPIKFRLLSRKLFPDGLSDVERAVLKRVAAGDTTAAEMVTPGVLDPETAKRALEWSWLKG
jgi:hypothetical protein